ncbi:hypothetical protein [Roseiconus nitratireducens]|nr:hypothetical protein [Roseiconus nitratireducens]
MVASVTEALWAQKGGKGKGNGEGDAAPAYQFIDLLGIDNSLLGYQSIGRFVTNRMQGELLVHGESYIRESGQPFYKIPITWTVAADGSFQPPDELGLPWFARELEATGFNELGVSIGITRQGYEPETMFSYAHVPGTGYVTMPDAYLLIGGINNLGQVVGQRSDTYTPALWQVQLDGTVSEPIDLGSFVAFDINDHGVMAGFFHDESTGHGSLAVAWFDSEQLQVNCLTGSIRAASYSGDGPRLNNCDFDDPRLAVVSTSWLNEQGEYSQPDSIRGMIWRPNASTNSFSVLDTLGGNSSYATDVNLAGEVVGFSGTKRDGHHAFLAQNSVLIDLNDAVSVGTNTLQQALSINDDGDITGFMRIPRPISEQRGFLLRKNP